MRLARRAARNLGRFDGLTVRRAVRVRTLWNLTEFEQVALLDTDTIVTDSLKSGAPDGGKGRNDTAKGHVFNSRIVSHITRPKTQLTTVGGQQR